MRLLTCGLLSLAMALLLAGCAASSQAKVATPAAEASGDNIPPPVDEEVAAVEARPQAVALRAMLADGVTGNEEIRAHLREEIATLEHDDPLIGWMTLRLAYMDMRVGDWTSARTNFRRVALSEIAAPMEVRAEATMRFARISNAPLERAMAIQAWNEIEQQAGDNWPLRARARTHIATMMLDQAAAAPAKDALPNVRIFVADSLSILPAGDKSIATTRAAIAASGVDSWAKESRWTEYLQAHDAWMAEHGDVANGDDWGNLWYSRGLALAALNREAEAETAMLAALGLDGRGPSSRRGLWTRQQSLRWLAGYATRQGQADEATVWNALNTLISSEGTLNRLHERAEKQQRPLEDAMWESLKEALAHIRN